MNKIRKKFENIEIRFFKIIKLRRKLQLEASVLVQKMSTKSRQNV